MLRPTGRAPYDWRPTRALDEAIGLYLSAGYVEVEAFNDEPFADHWFRKDALSRFVE